MNTKLIIGLIILVGLAGGYLLYAQLLPSTEAVPPPPINDKDSLKQFENLSIDFSFIDSATFRSLSTYGEIPVKPGFTGKKDIFAPF